MASVSVVTVRRRSLSPLPQPCLHPLSAHRTIALRCHSLQSLFRLQASRRLSAFSQGGGNLVGDPRNWSRIGGFVVQDFGMGGDDEDEDEDDEDEEEEDRSLDLLVRFVENMFKKISRKARKAVRSVLPLSISTKLVRFSVNGTIILAFLWILKAFLEVVCTLGSVVFVSILLIRGIWSWITYFQEIRLHKTNELDDEPHQAWTGAQPAS